jgi:hypothetical protein
VPISFGRHSFDQAARKNIPRYDGPGGYHCPGTNAHTRQNDGASTNADIVFNNGRLRIILLVIDKRIFIISHRNVWTNKDPMADLCTARDKSSMLNPDIVPGYYTSTNPGAGANHVAPAQLCTFTDGRELPDNRSFSKDY